MNENAKNTTGQKMSDFIVRQKKVLLSILAVAIVVIIVTGFLSITAKNRAVEVSNSTNELVKLFDDINMEEEGDAEEFIAYSNKLISEYSETNAELAAYSKLASYYFDKEKFEDAIANYTLAYTKFPNSISASVNMFNAAMSYDELGKVDEAIEVLELLVEKFKSINSEAKDLSSDVPEAIFNIARLYESKDDTENAVKNYEILVEEYQSYNLAGLAKSRLILIK